MIRKPAVESGDSAATPAEGVGAALATPALWLDNATADPLPAVKQALLAGPDGRRSLTIVDSHREAERAERLYRGESIRRGALAAALAGDFLDARRYPRRDKDNCANFGEVEAAERAGFAAGMSVCPICADAAECKASGYFREKSRADAATHAIATLTRASVSFLDLTADRDAVIAASDHALDLFRPPLSVTVAADKLLVQLAAVREATWEAEQATGAFWESLRDWTRELGERAGAIAPDRPGQGFIVPPFSETDVPRVWAAPLWAGFKKLTARRAAPALVRLLTAAVGGRAGEIVITARKDGDLDLTTAGRLALPTNKPVVVFCGESKQDLEHAMKCQFNIVGNAAPVVSAFLARDHVTARTRAATAAALIRGYMARPGVNKVGVLASRRAWMGTPARPGIAEAIGPLAKEMPGRVAIAFWHSDVRHLRDSDLILALGAPTIPPVAVRRRLIQTGQVEAAVQDGDWGRLPWVETAAAGGVSVIQPRCGYRNPAWQAVHSAALTATIRRTLSLIGRPAIILTDEQLDESDPLQVSAIAPSDRLFTRDALILDALQFAEAVRGVREGDTLKGSTPKVCKPAFSSSLKYLVAKMGSIPSKCHPITAALLASLTGLKTKTVANRLTILRAAGFVEWCDRVEGWTLARATWRPVVADESVVEPPAPPAPRDTGTAFKAVAEALIVAIAGIVASYGGRWEGTATKLEMTLAAYAKHERVKALQAWLSSADRIGRAVRRLTTPLQLAGVNVLIRRAKGGSRLIVLKSIVS